MSARKILSTILFLTVLGAIGGGIAYLARPKAREEARSRSSQNGGLSPSEAVRPSALPSPSGISRPRSASERESSWRAFQEKFGDRLSAQFSSAGRLVAIRGGVASRKAPGRFDPTDPKLAAARAKEVLEAASELLGIDPALPLSQLSQASVNASPTSAQVSFQETYDGIPIVPVGNVTVDLGPDGQLLGLDSTYVPGVQVSNPASLGPDEARARAIGAVPDQSSSLRVEGGNPVVWVPGAGAPGGARRAYQYMVQGYRVIVDATDGSILSRRDKRQY